MRFQFRPRSYVPTTFSTCVRSKSLRMVVVCVVDPRSCCASRVERRRVRDPARETFRQRCLRRRSSKPKARPRTRWSMQSLSTSMFVPVHVAVASVMLIVLVRKNVVVSVKSAGRSTSAPWLVLKRGLHALRQCAELQSPGTGTRNDGAWCVIPFVVIHVTALRGTHARRRARIERRHQGNVRRHGGLRLENNRCVRPVRSRRSVRRARSHVRPHAGPVTSSRVGNWFTVVSAFDPRKRVVIEPTIAARADAHVRFVAWTSHSGPHAEQQVADREVAGVRGLVESERDRGSYVSELAEVVVPPPIDAMELRRREIRDAPVVLLRAARVDAAEGETLTVSLSFTRHDARAW